MKRLLAVLAVLALVAGCGGEGTLGPVQTIDGQWAGLENGYAFSINVSQSGTDVSGSAIIGSNGGAVPGTASGTFVYPDVHLTLDFPNFQPVEYIGTMSSSQAKIDGKLNGSGLINVAISIRKK
jgi:hypothetical protein